MSNTTKTKNRVAATTPQLVRDAFSPGKPGLTLGDCMLLERLGVDFFLHDSRPGLRDMLVLWCLFNEREALEQADAEGRVAEFLDAHNDMRPAQLLAGMQTAMAAFKAAFAPANSGGDNTQGEPH